jgi:hypothetical protein
MVDSLIGYEVEEFFLQACHARARRESRFFCKRAWMPAWRGHDGKTPDPFVNKDFI